MSMAIRNASESDLPVILDIFNDVILNTTAIYQNQQMTSDEIVDWYQFKLKNHWPILIAEQDGRAIGFSTFGTYRARECYQSSVELAVHVAKEYRGQGVGNQLLSNLIQVARDRKFHVMMAGIDSANASSIQLHKKFGFQICGEIKQVAKKFDRWLDLTFMQLIL
jgi:L-amino acid N-acyltransferase YncA